MQRKYETAILFDPELPEEKRSEFLAKLEGIVASYQGEVLKKDDWGNRKLAYPIGKKVNAFYTFLLYTGNRGVVEEVERNIKIYDGILRYLTSRAETPTRRKEAAPAPVAADAPSAAGGETPEGEPPPVAPAK